MASFDSPTLRTPEYIRLRRQIGERPVVGITGSFAKTSTKHLLAQGLASQKNVVCNRASYNVLDGIRGTFRRVQPDTDIVIQELGATGPDTLNRLIIRTLPTIGVIATIADDHRKAFRNRQAVLEEKFKLLSTLPASGTAVINIDDPLLKTKLDDIHCRTITFGTTDEADIRGSAVSARWPQRLSLEAAVEGKVYPVKTRLIGTHHLTCVLAAIATAHALDADLDRFIGDLAEINPVPGRFRAHTLPNGATLLMDSFKAPQYSVAPVINFLSEAEASRKLLVLGQLADGTKANGEFLRATARRCREAGVELVCFGDKPKKSLRLEEFGFRQGVGVLQSVMDISALIRSELGPGDLVLAKSSIPSHFERLSLQDRITVRCNANHCGREGNCANCPEVGVEHPADFKFPGKADAGD